MKKAYEVTLTIKTRVIVDGCDFKDMDKISDHISEKAINQISEDVWNYVCEDNISCISEDTKYPYGALE